MTQGVSTTAKLPIAGSRDDKIVPVILGGRDRDGRFSYPSLLTLNLGLHCCLNSMIPSYQCPNNIQGLALLV
jgi:hypothetical protein